MTFLYIGVFATCIVLNYYQVESFPFCDENVCVEQKGRDINGKQVGDSFGIKTAVNGNGEVIAIGAIDFDGLDCDKCGRVEAYQWSSQSEDWVRRGQSIIGTIDNEFVSGVDLSDDGNLLAVGSPGLNDTSGVVRFYEFNNIDEIWTESRAPIFGENAGDQGTKDDRNHFKLNGAGNIVAVGGKGNDDVHVNGGYVRVFEWKAISSSWSQLGAPIFGEAEGAALGRSIALNREGDIIALGAHFHLSNRGSIRVFEYNGNSWSQLGQRLEGVRSGDKRGYFVSLNANGNILATSSKNYDGPLNNKPEVGVARVYRYNPASSLWQQIGNDIDGENALDRFGYRVSLNDIGDILAVGAFANDDGGNDAGQTRLYQFRDGSWVQLGLDIDGRAANTKTGQSLELSKDGSTVIIGGTGPASTSAGHVRVFSLTPVTPTKAPITQPISPGSPPNGKSADEDKGYVVYGIPFLAVSILAVILYKYRTKLRNEEQALAINQNGTVSSADEYVENEAPFQNNENIIAVREAIIEEFQVAEVVEGGDATQLQVAEAIEN